VQRRIERALADPQLLARHLANALRNRPAVQRFERDDAQDQEVECALDEIGRLAHGLLSVTDVSY
jgi:hypothetical protein